MTFLNLNMRISAGLVAAILCVGCSTSEEVRAAEAAIETTAPPSFVSASVCSDCHSRLYAPGVEPNWEQMSIVHHGDRVAVVDPAAVGPFSLWSGTMMRHAADDPYWRAKVRFESRTNPEAAAEIENTCLSCHAPAQQYVARFGDEPMKLDDVEGIGTEGVTCTVCHQISPDNLGSAESFTAGFVINQDDRIYGPHVDPFPMPMRMHTGKTPTESAHILESALCGTCHTVITPTLNATGAATGRFLEQATYLEWLASSFPSRGETCQSCHMPLLTADDGSAAKQFIAHTPHGGYFGPTRPRTPFGQHSFKGANVQMLNLLAEMIPERAEILMKSADRARETLNGAMELELRASRDVDGLIATVTVVNLTGHKLPSGFPSRRLWLHFTVTDAGGEVVFESGGFDPSTGRLLHEPARVAPHLNLISDAKQVLIYEAELADGGGSHTGSLMRAARYVKDNRLLPSGFNDRSGFPSGIDDLSIAPVGVSGDMSFEPGRDTVTYKVALRGSAATYEVRVAALYQSVKPSYLDGLDARESVEEAVFLKRFARHAAPTEMASASIVIANAEATLGR